eukprot:200735-Pleurochrysis_carterae.AAC.1
MLCTHERLAAACVRAQHSRCASARLRARARVPLVAWVRACVTMWTCARVCSALTSLVLSYQASARRWQPFAERSGSSVAERMPQSALLSHAAAYTISQVTDPVQSPAVAEGCRARAKASCEDISSNLAGRSTLEKREAWRPGG